MTPSPHTVGPDDPVETLERLMQEHAIRRLPVLEAGRVVGIVTERDLHRIVNPALPRVDKRRIRARAVLEGEPYLVEADTPLAQVAAEMAARRLGSAIVLRDGELAGVWSVTDACRLLAELLEAEG